MAVNVSIFTSSNLDSLWRCKDTEENIVLEFALNRTWEDSSSSGLGRDCLRTS
jgi:hypothetical protein